MNVGLLSKGIDSNINLRARSRIQTFRDSNIQGLKHSGIQTLKHSNINPHARSRIQTFKHLKEEEVWRAVRKKF